MSAVDKLIYDLNLLALKLEELSLLQEKILEKQRWIAENLDSADVE